MQALLICNTNIANFLQVKAEADMISELINYKRKFKPTHQSQKGVQLISDLLSFDEIDFEKEKPEFVLIHSELQWSSEGFDEGYEIANTLITRKLKEHFIQISFVSIFEKEHLLRFVSKKYHSFIRSFPHQCLMDFSKLNLFSARYSTVQFDLIKSLALADEGRINYIDHEIDTIKSNFEALPDGADLSGVKCKLLPQLEELAIFSFIPTPDFAQIKTAIESSRNSNALRKCFDEINELINRASRELPRKHDGDALESGDKSNYKVLIIEDEPEWRKFFSSTFGSLFNTVFPGNKEEVDKFDINEAKEIIENRTKDFNIIILDLLYKDTAGNWLLFNGLDLYKIAKEKNPYSCIRIITSLPRDIVAKTIGLLLKEDIPVSHIFTKKVGFEALRYSIQDRVLEIKQDCKEFERLKALFRPIPREGIFKWPSVPDMIIDLMTEQKGAFQSISIQAEQLFKMFQLGQLHIDSPGWNRGELPSTKMKGSISKSFLSNKLPAILTHRLMVIDLALNNASRIVFAEEYESRVLQKNVCKSGTLDKGYLTSKLGFSVSLASKNQLNNFTIELRNLFPNEIAYVSRRISEKEKDGQLILHKELHNWFLEILTQLDTYENWEELGLPFNLYQHASIDARGNILSSDISEDLTINALAQFLQSLIDNFSNPFVEKILIAAQQSFSINENLVKLPANIAFLINQVFEK